MSEMPPLNTEAAPEVHPAEQVETTPALELITSLGFTETAELSDLRQNLVETYRAGDKEHYRTLLRQYQNQAQELVESSTGLDRERSVKAQLGLNIMRALIAAQCGNLESLQEHLDDAWTEARSEQTPEHDAIAEKIVELGHLYGC